MLLLPRYRVAWDGEDGSWRVLELIRPKRSSFSRLTSGRDPVYVVLGWMRFATEQAAWQNVEKRA